jgi:sialidase-1
MAVYPPQLGDGMDIILFSNPGAETRACMTVRASFDCGLTWPVSRVIHEGPSGYSSMAVDTAGHIYVLFENGKTQPYERISLALFNLDWLRG